MKGDRRQRTYGFDRNAVLLLRSRDVRTNVCLTPRLNGPADTGAGGRRGRRNNASGAVVS